MQGADVGLLPPAAILLSLAGIQHGPHFDPLEIAFLFAVVIGGGLMLCLGFGAIVGCVTAALTPGASSGKSALIGAGVSACAGVACIAITLLGDWPIAYATVIVADVLVTIALVRRTCTEVPKT